MTGRAQRRELHADDRKSAVIFSAIFYSQWWHAEGAEGVTSFARKIRPVSGTVRKYSFGAPPGTYIVRLMSKTSTRIAVCWYTQRVATKVPTGTRISSLNLCVREYGKKKEDYGCDYGQGCGSTHPQLAVHALHVLQITLISVLG